MNNNDNHRAFSHEATFEKIQQDFKGPEITVYRVGKGYPNYGSFILCGLLPFQLVKQMLSDKSYISNVIEDVWVKPLIPPDALTYHRWGVEGDQYGFEPLVIKRKCDHLNIDIVEIAEEFRLFHDLHYAGETNNYLNPKGEVIVSVTVIEGGFEVKMRLSEIQSYLAVKGQYLSLLFEMNEYLEEPLKSLGLEATLKRPFHSEELLCWVYQYRDASSFSSFASNCYVRGRKFIAPAN
ncbi:MAG: hypothetical protein OXD54_06845 [Candidatus Poribacteria bacterium]|nr:hypothetical protein [Candidatus Poribacteria bacterium]